MSDKNEKIVFIRRKLSFMEEANIDPEVQEYFGMAYKAVGSYYKTFGRQFGSGLTRKEEEIIMPEMVGYFPDLDKREFRSSVVSFFRNINTKIPPEGLRLNVALEDPNEPLYRIIKLEGGKEKEVINYPVNIKDFIIYRHAREHPEVGGNEEEAMMYQHVRFYIEDEEGVTAEASKLNEYEDSAFLKYHKIIDSPEKVNQMLTLLGQDASKMSVEDKKLKLKEFASINPKISAARNEMHIARFIELSDDKHLEVKYLIEEMVKYNVLERVGQRILIAETSDEIGRDLKEATLWFLDKGHTKQVNVLNARYKEFARVVVKPIERDIEATVEAEAPIETETAKEDETKS